MNNSEILFLYDAVLCNPNGDIDEENQPRMDRETNRNLVSDVRLKRYIRDYLLGKGYEIFVAELEGKTVDATTRLEEFCRKYGLLSQKENLQNALKDDEKRKQIFEKVLDQMFDVRVFGAVIPIKPGEERAGQQETFTGPVQFNWGYSLNPVTINLSSSITSIFAGRTRGEGEQYGTIGKDWRVFYSLIAFHGIVSAKRGKITRLKEEDIFILDDALLKSIPVEATTRSKVGQFPRLLLRVEYKDDETFLGDLRPYLKIRPNEGIDLEKIRTVEDYELEVSPLLELLKDNEDRINRFFVWQHNSLKLVGMKSLKELLEEAFGSEKVFTLPHNQ